MKKNIPAYLLMMALASCSPNAVKERIIDTKDPVPKDTTAVVRQPEKVYAPEKKHRVAVFSGHMKNPTGRNNSGAVSAQGINEYVYNDDLTSRVKDNEEIDFTVYSATLNIPLSSRLDTAKKIGAEIYLEFHHDAAQTSSIRDYNTDLNPAKAWKQAEGFSIFYNPKSKESLKLATLIGRELVREGFTPNRYHAKKIKGESRTLVDTVNGIYDGSHLFVVNSTLPSILLECGVIVNPYEEPNHRDSRYHNEFAEAVRTAVSKYFRDKESR